MIKVFENISVGSMCPYLIENGNARGLNYPTFGGARGVPFMDNNQREWFGSVEIFRH